MRERRKNRGEEGVNSDWALSYGDMMTLLLTFFVLIVSFSTTELIKFRKAMGSLRGSEGVLLEQDGNSVVQKNNNSPSVISDREIMMRMLKEVEAQVFKMDMETAIDIEVVDGGITFRLDDELVFEPGEVELRPAIREILNYIGKMIQNFSCHVRVEGHTDNIPIQSERFPSNWELSAYRAIRVLRYFTEEMRLHPTRFLAVGYGEHRPLMPNDTPQHRKTNRRVEIFLEWRKAFETFSL